MTQDNKLKKTKLLIALISLGIIIGLFYGLIETIISVSNHNYFQYKLYNIALNIFQQNLNSYILLFCLLSIIFLFLPAVIINWIKSDCLDIKVIRVRNLRILLYSFFAIIVAAALYYLYHETIILSLESNNLSTSIANNLDIGMNILSIALFLLTASAIILICALILSKINILNPAQNFIHSIINSTITRSLGLGIIVLLVLFNIFIYGYQKLQTSDGPNVILISIDTLRADHLGAYGYDRNTSPNIDRLAQEGVLFENAFSQAPWTLPAMTSIHTSLYPSQHGVIDYDTKIDNKYITIAEFLKNSYYKTIGVISMPFVDSKYGFSQGFGIFNEKHISGLNDISSDLITAEAINYLDQNKNNKFFLWVHYFDPHGSYIDHNDINYVSAYKGNLPKKVDPSILNFAPNYFDKDDLEYIKDLYDEEIAFTDKNIGDLIAKVNKLGLEENTIIIITSDHGEEFMERGGFGHRKLLYNELIKVPLIIYNPIDKNLNGIRKKNNVETRSIAKTIVDIIEIPNNPFSGQNLLSDKELKDNNYVFSNVYKKGDILKESVISNNLKLIKNNDDDSTYELYNFYSDKREKNNIYGSKQISITTLQSDLLSKLDELQKNKNQNVKQVDLNSDDVKKLKALGYLQ